MPLSLADARRVIGAAQEKAATIGVKVCVAVVDEGAHLVALERVDGVSPVAPVIAEGKAVGAASFRRDGASLLTMANERVAFFDAVKGMTRTTIVPGPGSVLITRGGAVIGAVGVSGAKPDEDHACAEAGAASIA